MRFFLSYASEDKVVAEEIYFALIGAGHEVFFDKPLIKPGDNYERRICEAIDTADGFVFLISPVSIKAGGYALTELKYAREKWKHPENRVLPVMVTPTPYDTIPAFLRSVSILKPDGNVAAEVTDSVKGWGNPLPPFNKRYGILSQFGKFFYMLLSSFFVAIGLGTLFTQLYPSVEIGINLVFLFVIVGFLIVKTIRHLWSIIILAWK
jgi:TIR domain